MTTPIWFLRCGALLAAIGVLLGAFGAHALKGDLDDAALAIWQTASRYHLIHALGLILVALWMRQVPSKFVAVAGWCLLAGVVFFSGSLYGLALSGPSWLGPITPLGGLLLIAGWLSLFLAAIKQP